MHKSSLWFLLVFCLLLGKLGSLHAQSPLPVQIHALIGDQALVLEDSSYQIEGEQFTFSLFKFYVSNIKLTHQHKVVWSEPQSYHLIDWEDSTRRSFELSIPPNLTYDGISCLLGIDSSTNAAGIFGEDLDPTKGMYWTWNTGFINFKLEGTSSASPSRKSQFLYHLGGYIGEQYCAQPIHQEIRMGKQLSLTFAIDQFLSSMDLKQTYSLMSPGLESVKVSQYAAQSIEIYVAPR